jgi:hypothetical protein
MKKGIVLLFFSLFFLGCSTFDEELAGFKNCDKSEDCIKNAVRNCQKAYAFDIKEDALTIEK